MSNILTELIALLGLEKLEENLYRGQSQDLGWGTVYGGQVLGQALSAAVRTVPTDRPVHSLHGYFLRPGRVDMPIVYDVDRIRDGGTFATRRVVAIQNGKAIFNMSASFHAVEEGFEHADEPPEVDGPTDLLTEEQRILKYADSLPEKFLKRATAERPFEVRSFDPLENPFKPSEREPKRMYWFRAMERLPDDDSLHRYLLAYASDFGFITTALLPYGVNAMTRGMQVASLDHAMWFHRPFRVDEWLLYVVDSPSASGGRGLVRGQIYDANGRLVASTAQEGLIRNRNA